MAFAALTIDLNARLAKFEQDMARTSRSLDGLNSKVGSVASGFKSAFGVLGATLSVGALASFAKSGIDAADSLAKMSVRTGVATRDLASFQLAADSADTSMEGVAKGLGKLNRSIGEAEAGNKLIASSLKELGVTAKEPKEAFYQLADAVANIQDPTKRAYLLNNVLGKSYEDLLPLLSQGGDALRESAKASESFADAMARLAPDAEKFNDTLTAMKNSAAGAAAALLADLVPAMNSVLENVRQAQLLSGHGFGFLQLLGMGVNPTQNPADQLKTVNAELANAEQKLARMQGYDPWGARESLEQKIEQYRKLRGFLIDQNVANINAPPQTDALKALKQSRAAGLGNIKIPSTAGGAKSDPLASLLASTDIGKLQAFDKQVALLNQRFDYGRKSTEIYSQAMTKLVETTFASNFSDFNKQLAEQDETQRMVAEHLQSTNDALYEQQQAWIDAGRALEEEMRTPLENANIELGRLDDLLERGAITWETYTRAVFKTQEAIEGVNEKTQEIDTFAKTAAKNIQNSFADFLFNPFENGLKGMAQSFGQMIQRMIAEAVAADLTRKLFGESGSGGLLGFGLEAFGKILGFANGGVMTSAGPLPLNTYAGGGIANTPQLALFGEGRGPEAYVPLPDGRSIPVKMQGGSGATSLTLNFYGMKDSSDIRRAGGEVSRTVMNAMRGAGRYG